jgi:hypothetical protein
MAQKAKLEELGFCCFTRLPTGRRVFGCGKQRMQDKKGDANP